MSPSLFIVLSGCGGGGGRRAAATSFTVSGSVAGLAGSGLKVRANSTDVAITSDGAVTLLSGVVSGTQYTITVVTQPSTPAQIFPARFISRPMVQQLMFGGATVERRT